jgi:hypothetical protein
MKNKKQESKDSCFFCIETVYSWGKFRERLAHGGKECYNVPNYYGRVLYSYGRTAVPFGRNSPYPLRTNGRF